MIEFPVLRHGRRLEMVQRAQMSSRPPGGGGENAVYFVLVGAACLGGGIYVSTLMTLFFSPISTVHVCGDVQ